MEASDERSVSSLTNRIDKVTSVLKRQSRFFVGIDRSEFQNLTEALEELDNFLDVADDDSVEEVARESVKSWLEEPRANRCLEKDSVQKLSRLLQNPRIIDFLGRASEMFSQLNSGRGSLSPDTESSRASPLEDKQKHFKWEEEEEEEEEEETILNGFVEKQKRKLFYSFLEEYVDSAAKEVTHQLRERTLKRSFIALLGPSGIGKSLIAREVYNREIVANSFDFFGWIDVSSSYNVKETLKAMIQQVAREWQDGVEGLDAKRTMELFFILKESLQRKRYMIVFDDVCREEFWNVIKQGLPENEKGSRIIMTTTSQKIADSCTEIPLNYVHRLSPLSDAMSWELFCRIAFQDLPGQLCPTELEHLSLGFLRVCQGFQLSIAAVAGLLSTKGNIMLEWMKLYDNLRDKFQLNARPPSALEALTFDLPNHLRPCLFYFIIFPEESLIPTQKLFQLWIAEGFVEEKKGRTLTEVAEEYLNELIHRDLVKLCQYSYSLEQFCQVHKLIHDMGKVKAHDELNFRLIRDGNSSNFQQKDLRLSIYNVNNALETIRYAYVRAVFLFNIGAFDRTFMITLTEHCERLTLLDLENIPIEDLPEQIGNFSNLKYLNLKNTKVQKLPESVGKLLSLQTLDLRNTLLTELPLGINKLRQLQHLLATFKSSITSRDSTRGVRMKGGIRLSEKLQILMIVDVTLDGTGLIKELAKLLKLRRLGISGLTAEVGSVLCTAIDKLIHLETLTLQAKSNEILKLQNISTMLPRLKCLVLKGQLQKFPHLIVGHPNLTTLCLSLSNLANIPLFGLSCLPNLMYLWLYRAYKGETLYFKESCTFHRLKLLVLRELRGLNEVEIEKGALPSLEELRIGSSPHLNKVPSGIRHLRNLKVLSNYDMSREFVMRMQPDAGSDYWKVKHISSVFFWYRVEGRIYKLYKLGDSDLLDHLQGLATNRKAVPQGQDELSTFCESDNDDEEEDHDEIGRLSRSSTLLPQKSTNQWSFSSGFYSDDVEE